MYVNTPAMLGDVPVSKVTAADICGGSACTDCSRESVQLAEGQVSY